jgi:hypothetical protein
LKSLLYVEPIPKPIFISEFIRVSELLSRSVAQLIILKLIYEEAIFEFWDQLILYLGIKIIQYSAPMFFTVFAASVIGVNLL